MGCGTVAHAQEASTNGLAVRPSVEATYDSNVFRQNSNVRPTRDDVIVSPGVEVEYSRPLGRNSLKVRGSAYLDAYVNGSTQARLRALAAADGIIKVGARCQTVLTGLFQRQRSDFGDINTTTPNLQSVSTLRGEFACPEAVGFYPIGSIERTTTDNSRAYAFADQTTMSYRGGVGFGTPSIGTFSLYYEHSDTDRPSLALTNKIERAGITFNRSVVSHAAIETDVHWLRVRSSNAGVPDYDNPGWKISLVLSPVPTVLSFRGSLIRAVVNDSLVPAGYAVSTSYLGSGEWLFSDRTKAEFSYEHADRSYRRDPFLFSSLIDSDKVNLYTLAVRRKIGRALEFYLRGQRVTRSTNSGIGRYTANLIGLGVSADF